MRECGNLCTWPACGCKKKPALFDAGELTVVLILAAIIGLAGLNAVFKFAPVGEPLPPIHQPGDPL